MIARKWFPAMLLALPLLGFCTLPLLADPLDDVKARMKIESQRIEKEFAAERAAAYKLVRSGSPKLLDATEKLQTLKSMIQADTSLDLERRKVLLATIEFDLGKVRQIAAENRRTAINDVIARSIRSDARRAVEDRAMERRRPSNDAAGIIESRGRSLADARSDRKAVSDGFSRTTRDVARSAIPESRAYSFPKDWVEKSRKRSSGQKLTEKEKAILKALNTTIEADFDDGSATFEEVLDWLKKKTGLDFAVDKRAMDEVSVTYKTPVRLKLKGTTRTILKKLLADLNLAYFIKSETVQITSQERAKSETTTRTYYVGDLAAVTDLRFGPIYSKVLMIQNLNSLINTITQTIEPRSWQVNNPDAVGTITFDPGTMSLIVKQTAEMHFMMGGGR